jgi:hypothetical protein
LTEQTDLEALLPAREITLKGEVMTVAPFTFGMLPKAVKLMQPLAEALRSANVVGFHDGIVSLAPDWPMKVPQIVAEGGEALLDLLAFVIAKPRKWFDTLGMDEGIALTKLALEVNADFFQKKVAPMFPTAKPAELQPATGDQLSDA